MVHNRTTNFRNLAAQFFPGSIALASVTLAFFRLGVDLASTTFAYLIVIVLFATIGSFIVSALLAVISVVGLVHCFAPPFFDFRIGKPQHIMAVVALLPTSSMVMRLIRSARERTEAVLQAEAYLRRREIYLRDGEKHWREFFEHHPGFVFHDRCDRNGPVGEQRCRQSLITLSGTSKEND